MSRPTDPLDLSPFCDSKDDSRYSLGTPWIDDGWQYATDSRVCVRQPTTKRPPDDGQRRPKVDSLFANFPRCVEKWPAHDGVKARRPCQKCEEVVPRMLVIGGRMIACEYCLNIHALGDVLHGPDGPPDEPVAFVCGELQGKVNSLRENTES